MNSILRLSGAFSNETTSNNISPELLANINAELERMKDPVYIKQQENLARQNVYNRKSRKANRKNRKSRKANRKSRKNRKQH